MPLVLVLFTFALGTANPAATMVGLSPLLAGDVPTIPLFSAADVTTARGAPVTAAQHEVYTQAVGTTPAALLGATEVSAANQNAYFVQNFRVVNRDASKTVCLSFPNLGATADCATKCAAATTTCSGASTDGAAVLAGSSYVIPVTGLQCGCAVASSASATVTAERVGRYPQ